jgi:hypothetical protein
MFPRNLRQGARGKGAKDSVSPVRLRHGAGQLFFLGWYIVVPSVLLQADMHVGVRPTLLRPAVCMHGGD